MECGLDLGFELLPSNVTDVTTEVSSGRGSNGSRSGWEYGEEEIAPESSERGDWKGDIDLQSLLFLEDFFKGEKVEKIEKAEEVVEETAVEKADFVAEGERRKKFLKRKRARDAELNKFLKESEDQEVDLSYARRLICNRDSAAARRMKDTVYRDQLCLALKDLEIELEQLEKQKREMQNEYAGVMGNAEIFSGPSVA
uniref:BZIP domain-containing protein n=1 Tax=Rhodosorus marinus TaxID=101924 RepID=A0A7S2ZYR9_9RHOD|mmetsp:Transcript_36998/g.147666  ORF Transcript_36998/g.147666 Transcript_36998/m.147666 type:complete len:198 (+) Transcript_36998:178-771(+)